MARFGWAPYVPVARRRANAARLVARLRKQGRTVTPVEVEGRKIAKTFWGRAWCDNLEAYSDHANRLPRGRTYARNGSIVDLQIHEGRIEALVSGSDVYEVSIGVAPAPAERWRDVARRCAGRIDSVVELLSGKLSKGVMEVLASRESGLFPARSELRAACSCPDGARLCKHLAAVLYGVGARLDHEPDLLFRLRSVDSSDLVAEAESGAPRGASDPSHGAALAPEGLSELFGIDLEDDDPAPPAPGPAAEAPTARPAPAAPKRGPAAAPKRGPSAAPGGSSRQRRRRSSRPPARSRRRAPAATDRLLAALTRPTLLRLCAAFDLARTPGYQKRAALERELRRYRGATVPAVLDQLKRTELQRACAKLDLPTTGRRKAELRDRIQAQLQDAPVG